MIKKPVNFAIGVFCGMCFIINIMNHGNTFTLTIAAFATVLNIAIGLMG